MIIPITEDEKERQEPTINEARKRIKEKSKEIRKKNIVPPMDENEPLGVLSGGPEHIDTNKDKNE